VIVLYSCISVSFLFKIVDTCPIDSVSDEYSLLPVQIKILLLFYHPKIILQFKLLKYSWFSFNINNIVIVIPHLLSLVPYGL